VNAKTNTESHARIANLKRKIFWRDTLSFLFCIFPIPVLCGGVLWLAGSNSEAIAVAGCFAVTGFVFWLSGICDNAADFLFGDKFRVQSERFIEIEKAEARETLRKEREERETKKAKIIAALEHDMRVTGILKAPIKEAP